MIASFDFPAAERRVEMGRRNVSQPLPKERRHPLELARPYQALLDAGKVENRAALDRYLGVSRAWVTQVLKWLKRRFA